MHWLQDDKLKWLLFSIFVVGVFEFLSFSGINVPPYILIPISLLIMVFIGHHTIVEGFKALIKLDFTSINLLMLIAVIGAMILNKWEEAVAVIVLYTLAEKLEDLGIEQSKSSISSLTDKMPKTAVVKGVQNPVPVDKVAVGNIILIKPGEAIPLDGMITVGTTSVDESMITGEPLPKDKLPDDTVFAGTLNRQGFIEVRVTKVAQESALAKIQEITFQAAQAKSHTQKFIEVFSSYYTPFVVLLSLTWMILSIYVWGVEWREGFLNALALLVISCPCALVISTPVSIYAAIGNAASKGILIKGGRYLEALGKVKAVAFDKTRTLTFGEPHVTDVIPLGSISRDELLSCVAGIESYSEHPLAKSIVQKAKDEELTPHPVENFQIQTGKGAQADCLICSDRQHYVGKLGYILEKKENVPEDVLKKIDELQTDGKTVAVVCTPAEIEGIIGLQDTIRPECKEVITELKSINVTPVMLTGDNAVSARVVADEVGIQHVEANLLPEEKASAMDKLLKQYGDVAMIGDGINDAPALATSSVGISMSQLGSDTAIEAASVVVLNDHLGLLPYMINLGRRTLSIIKTNITAAVAVKAFFIALALAGWSNLALAVFADVGVTLLVILNGLRLSR